MLCGLCVHLEMRVALFSIRFPEQLATSSFYNEFARSLCQGSLPQRCIIKGAELISAYLAESVNAETGKREGAPDENDWYSNPIGFCKWVKEALSRPVPPIAVLSPSCESGCVDMS